MALRLADVLQQMKSVFEDGQVHELDVEPKVFGLASDFLLAAIGRSPEQGRIAILLKEPDAEQLSFVYPRHLARGMNSLPIDRESIAGRVLLGGQPIVENDVVGEPHRDIFELIPDDAGRLAKIQKMVAAPLVDENGAARGVVEVSRAGADRAAAGEDFGARDAENLAKCCKVFAPLIFRAWRRGRA